MFRPLNDYNFHNKRTLLRCDFNVPVANGYVSDDFKLQKSLFTIKFLKKAGAKIIILSHFGSPWDFKGKKERREKCTLKPVHQKLQTLLREKIEFMPKAISGLTRKKIKKMKPGDIIMLENLRFYREEEGNDQRFAEKLASLGDVYVGEHFSVCHRANASVALLPKMLPRLAGPELLREIEMLSMLFRNPPRPLVAVIGGAKVSSKLKLAAALLRTADFLLFGGKLANTILTVKGISVSKPWPDEEVVENVRKFELTSSKIYLPVDVLCSSDIKGKELLRESSPGMVRRDEEIFDIGQETIQTFSEIVKQAGTVFWVGPLGLAEEERFAQGTKCLAQAIADSPAQLKIVGGGETVAAVRRFGLLDKFSFVSAGGGAMLTFLARERMPGLEALKT